MIIFVIYEKIKITVSYITIEVSARSRTGTNGFPLNFTLNVEGTANAKQQLQQFAKEIEKLHKMN